MNTYRVENMTCGHCVRTVESAVHAVDADAKVDVDLAAGMVRIDGGTAEPEHLALAIGTAGYPASLVAAGTSVVADTRSVRRGCCCG